MEHYTLSGYKYAFSYDANGNRTAMQILYNDTPTGYVKEYEWNEDDRLTRVTASLWGTPLKTVEYQYCRTCGGQRTGRIEYDEAEMIVEWLRYEMDGLNHLRIDEVYDADSNGELEDPSASGDAWRVQRVYVNGPGQLGQIAKVIVFNYASATSNAVASEDIYYYHYDILGNVSVISGDNGDEADQFEQDAFGNLVAGSWSGRVGGITEQITTKQYDEDLGLYYFNARWYDPQVGAFVSYDKWDRLGLRYMYAGASPSYFVDITGQKATSGAFRVHRGCRQDACDCLLKVLPESGPPLTSVAVSSWWQSVRQMNVDAVYLHDGILKIAGTAVCWVSCNRSGRWRRYPYRIGCIDSSGPAADIVRTITGNDTRAGLYKPGYTPSKGWPDNPFTLWIDEQISGIELKSPDYRMYYGEENDGHFYLGFFSQYYG